MNSKYKLSKPYASSSVINREWSKVLKTLDKSINIAPISFPLFRLLHIYQRILVLWFLQNPVRFLEDLPLICINLRVNNFFKYL